MDTPIREFDYLELCRCFEQGMTSNSLSLNGSLDTLERGCGSVIISMNSAWQTECHWLAGMSHKLLRDIWLTGSHFRQKWVVNQTKSNSFI